MALGSELKATLRRLMELRDERDATKTAAEDAEKEYREKEAELWEELEDSPVSGGIKLDIGEPYGVVSFAPVETHYGRVLDSEKAQEYFEQSAQVEEYTQPKIVGARINELARECLEEGKAMPPGLDWYARRYIRITRPK